MTIDPQQNHDWVPPGPGTEYVRATRWMLAKQYLNGAGVEVGALHMPLPGPPNALITYVDRMSVDDLRHHYPELAGFPLVPVHVIDDGETLSTFADESLDFVIANHFIEHSESPIKAIQNHLRVLKVGGIIYMAVPDKRFTFDIDRQLTTVDHIVKDYREGPEWSRHDHFVDFAANVKPEFVTQIKGTDAAEDARLLEEIDYSIHFHVWEPATFVEMLVAARRELNRAFELEAMYRNEHEFIVVLRKLPVEA